jgi:hypothetical protein
MLIILNLDKENNDPLINEQTKKVIISNFLSFDKFLKAYIRIYG